MGENHLHFLQSPPSSSDSGARRRRVRDRRALKFCTYVRPVVTYFVLKFYRNRLRQSRVTAVQSRKSRKINLKSGQRWCSRLTHRRKAVDSALESPYQILGGRQGSAFQLLHSRNKSRFCVFQCGQIRKSTEFDGNRRLALPL